MKRLLIGMILMFFAVPIFAQTAPDYKDGAKWKYFECDGNFFQPQDEEYYLLHQDYWPLGQESDYSVVIVAYKPVKLEALSGYREVNIAIYALKPEPWFLLYVRYDDPAGITADIYEFKNGDWVVVKFESRMYGSEIDEYLKRTYNLQ